MQPDARPRGRLAGSGAAGSEDVIRKILLAIAVVASVAFLSRIVLKLRRRRQGTPT